MDFLDTINKKFNFDVQFEKYPKADLERLLFVGEKKFDSELVDIVMDKAGAMGFAGLKTKMVADVDLAKAIPYVSHPVNWSHVHAFAGVLFLEGLEPELGDFVSFFVSKLTESNEDDGETPYERLIKAAKRRNFKGEFHEYLQARHVKMLPVIKVSDTTDGFLFTLDFKGVEVVGEGKKKRFAEQQAYELLLREVRTKNLA